MNKLSQGDLVRLYYSAVENYGRPEGNWLQIERAAFDDLIRKGFLPKNYTYEGIMKDPDKYLQTAIAYDKYLEKVMGIPTLEERAIWAWRPGWYKKYKGDIEAIPDDVKGVFGKSAKEVMRSRVRNLRDYLLKAGLHLVRYK